MFTSTLPWYFFLTFSCYISDGELKCICIRTARGEIICNIHHEIKDDILALLTSFLEPFGVLISTEKGSLVLNIRFSSLIKLTAFWLAYLDGSLARDMLGIFVTEEMKQQHDIADLRLDLKFTLNDYVKAAYDLDLNPFTLLNIEGERLHYLSSCSWQHLDLHCWFAINKSTEYYLQQCISDIMNVNN